MQENHTAGKQSTDVLVVGAGPTGMVAALALTRLGLRCRVVDKAKEHKQHSQAGVLWPRTQEVLDSLGLLKRWEGRASYLNRVTMFGYGKQLGDVVSDRADSPRPKPMLIGQNETEGFLEELCSELGCPVEREVEATALTQTEGSVEVRLRHCREGREEVSETAWVLGTDGGNSTVRKLLELPWNPDRFEGQHVFQVDAVTRWALPLDAGHAYFFLHDEGYFGCVPLPDGYHRFFLSESDSKQTNVEDPQLEQMQRLIEHLSGFPVRLSEPRWLSGKHYQNVITSQFRARRVLLAGDAGKAVVPLNGQGMNTGIQDAYNLAWKLAAVHRGQVGDEVLDSYDWERRGNAERLVNVTGNYFTHVTSPSKLQEAAVRALGSMVLNSRHVQERYTEFASMLDISYRESGGRFVADHQGSGERPLRAGDRAPDAMVVDGDGLSTVSLYRDVYRYQRWTLLLLAGQSSKAEIREAELELRLLTDPLAGLISTCVVWRKPFRERGVAGDSRDLLDYTGELHQRYSGRDRGLFVLVRPDQHVAWMGGLGGAEALDDYIRMTFLPGDLSTAWPA